MKFSQRVIAAAGIAASLAGILTAGVPAQAVDKPTRGQSAVVAAEQSALAEAPAALPSTSPALKRYPGTSCLLDTVVGCATVGEYTSLSTGRALGVWRTSPAPDTSTTHPLS